MKIVVLTVDHVYANLVLKEIVNSNSDEIAAVIESDVLLNGKSLFASLVRYWKVAGNYYFINQVVKLLIYKILSYAITNLSKDTKNKFYSYKRILAGKKILHLKERNINSDHAIEIITKLAPDLVISVYFNQILKERLLSIPKYGAINVHPAYLPDYKGVSPVFWALVNGEKFTGVSVHAIDKGVDTGDILSQAKVSIDRADTEDSLYWRCSKKGALLVVKVVKNIRNGKINGVKSKKNNVDRYFSLPTREAVGRFRRNKRKFFYLKNYIFIN